MRACVCCLLLSETSNLPTTPTVSAAWFNDFTKADKIQTADLNPRSLKSDTDRARRVHATYLAHHVVVIGEPLVLERTRPLGADAQRHRAVHGHTRGDGVTHDGDL